jgi:hypothetical protein
MDSAATDRTQDFMRTLGRSADIPARMKLIIAFPLEDYGFATK